MKGETRTVVLLMRENPRDDPHTERMEELKGLAKAAGYKVTGQISQRRGRDGKFQLGRGKIEEAMTFGPEKLVFYNPLSPGQVYNISKEFDIPVIDRFNLILEIFASRASSKEAHLQVELAQLSYRAPFVKVMESLRKLSERPGYGGSGSYDISMYRDIKARIAKIKGELKGVEDRGEKRRQRRKDLGFDLVALAGYTNAGKSTLFNTLAKEGVSSKDQPFTTLSPTTRALDVKGRRLLLTDTVGFISDLPLFLIKAFRSTLAEIVEADLVLLVSDLSDPAPILREKLVACHEVLWDCGNYAPIVTVFNKADRLSEEEISARIETVSDLAPSPVTISAKNCQGLGDLIDLVLEKLPPLETFEIKLSSSKDGMGRLSRIYEVAEVLEVDYGEEIVALVKGRPDTVFWALKHPDSNLDFSEEV